MKKNKIFGVLSLALVGVFGLASCAPAVVTPEEAKEAIGTIKKAYEDGKVETPSEAHVTISYATKQTMGDKTKEEAIVAESMVDLANHKSYAKATAGEEVMFEYWSYIDNGKLITALSMDKTKTYMEVPVAADKINTEFDATFSSKLAEDYLGAEGVEFAGDLLISAMKTDESAVKEEYGDTATFELNAEYRSNMKDNLYATYSAAISATEGKQSQSVTQELSFKIDEYLLGEFAIKMKMEAKNDGKVITSIEQSESIAFDKSASISLPKLADFTKGIFVDPTLPF